MGFECYVNPQNFIKFVAAIFEKIEILNFFSSPNAGLKPSLQSRSNSIYRILLQIFLARIFVFNLPLKLRVVHIRKNYKISIFSKIAPTKLIKFYGFTLHSKPNNVRHLRLFPKKIPETEKKKYFSVWPSPNGKPNPTDKSHPISIFRAPLQISQFPLFLFLDLLLKLRVVHIRKNYKICIFSKNGSNEIDQILWVYSTFETQ